MGSKRFIPQTVAEPNNDKTLDFQLLVVPTHDEENGPPHPCRYHELVEIALPMTLTPLLVTTRLSPPRLSSHALLRKPLLMRLQQAQDSRLILVTGGAGFGKTTLLAQWRQGLIKAGKSVVWLSLVQEDCRLETFCASLIGALQQAGLPLDSDLLLLIERESHAGLQALASVLINTLARVDTPLYLMLDDFQFANSPLGTQLVQRLVDGAPANLHIVLASRVSPELKLGRLRAMAELCEIDCTDLCFSFMESLNFLKTYLDDEISSETAHAIHDTTDGWPIGLQLMSIALKSAPRTDPKTLRLLPGKAGLGDYLTEDVLSGLPGALVDFLEKIAILRRFNVNVARHVAQADDAAELIAAIEARNLFILPVDMEDSHQWYRFHPLFAEFLQQRLASSNFDVKQLHRRAMDWFESTGLVNEAIRHAVLSDDLDVLVSLLSRSKPPHHNLSNLGQYMRWLDCVPLERLARHPNVLLQGAWSCIMTMLTSKAETWLNALQTDHGSAALAPHIELVKAAIAFQRDDLTLAFRLLEPLRDHVFVHPFHQQMRACLYLSCLSHQGQHQRVRDYINDSAANSLYASQDELALLAIGTATYGELLAGNILDTATRALDLLHQAENIHGRRSISTCHCAVMMAEIHYELDRIDDAREALSGRLDLLQVSPSIVLSSAMITTARLKYLQESPAAALEYLAPKTTELRAKGFDRALAHNLCEQVRILLTSGDWRQCESQRASLDALAHRHAGDSMEDHEIAALAALSRARVSLARQEPALALDASQVLAQLAERYGRGRWKIQAELLGSLARDLLGQRQESHARLRGALRESERLGLVRTLLDESPALQTLLAQLDCEDDPVLDSYRHRLAASPLPAFASPQRLADTASAGTSESPMFTRREQEIIGLLEQSMSNKRIAQTLNLSLETVKWNLKNIYAKLGVSGRYEAIVAARQQTKQS
ncbi:HTH-type transcriptional regulator MalT [compost metagenome]